jgi:hypothetical protein
MNNLASPPVVGGSRLPRSSRSLNTGRSSARSSEVTFVRRVDVQLEEGLSRLEQWWQASARDGIVDIGRSRLIVPLVTDADTDRCRIDIILSRGALWPDLPMVLELVRWSAAFGTRLELEPDRDVRPHDRYFRAGHGVLDRVAAVMEGRS